MEQKIIFWDKVATVDGIGSCSQARHGVGAAAIEERDLHARLRASPVVPQYFIPNRMVLVATNTTFLDYWRRCSSR